MNFDDLPPTVIQAFEVWLARSLWKSTLNLSERGRLGAAKRKLNAELKRHGLTFRAVAQLHL